MALTDAELARYHADGYLVMSQLVIPERMQRLSAEVDGLHEQMQQHEPDGVGVAWEQFPDQRPPRIRQLMNSERVCPMVDAISRDDALLSVLAQVIGPDVLLFHSKLMMKAAHDGSFTPWHQDWGYWRQHCEAPSQVNCMLAIDAATEANGCIRFVPGSHKQGPLDHSSFDSSSFNIGLPGDLDAYDAVPVALQPGDAVIFGPLVIHGSAPNTSPSHRRANTFAFDRVSNRNPDLPPDRLRLGQYGAPAAVYASIV